jgi:two-component system, cell cycle sensor histidine kinase DivJ
VGLFAPIRNLLGVSMHPSAQEDLPEARGAAAMRQRAFLAPRLLGGLGMLASVAIAFMPHGMPSVFEIALLAWLAAGFLIAYFLSRAGEDESAHVLSTLALTGLVTTAAFSTGGLNSFAAIWLVLVPAEAALSGSRRVVALASTVALGAAGFLLLTSTFDPVAPKLASADGPPMLAMLGIVSALLYAMGLALGSQAPARGSGRPERAEADSCRLLACNMADVVTRHDRNGQVLFASSAAEPVLGAALHELLGRGLFDRIHVADRPAYLTALRDAATLRESRTVEIRARRASLQAGAGGFVWIEMRCWPVARTAQAQPGEGCEVVAVMRDVTARKDEEHAVADARAQAERANVAKSRFLATMSHELRTPLNAIIGFSEMLREEGALMIDARQRHDYAQLINESGHHLLSVVNGILDMSKIESGNFEIVPEPVATARVIAECCELLALRARQAGIEVVVELKDDLPEIVADKRALLQIMLNLLSNAVKFTNRGGKVTITATAASGHAAGRDPVHASGDEPAYGDSGEAGHEAAHIVIKVEDTGVGIGAEDLPRVGEPFFQARSSYDRRHDGTGLGVSIVRGLLSLHGGWMEIESRVGAGTSVAVHLPLDCESARRKGGTLARVAPRAKDTPSDLRPDIAVKRRA